MPAALLTLLTTVLKGRSCHRYPAAGCCAVGADRRKHERTLRAQANSILLLRLLTICVIYVAPLPSISLPKQRRSRPDPKTRSRRRRAQPLPCNRRILRAGKKLAPRSPLPILPSAHAGRVALLHAQAARWGSSSVQTIGEGATSRGCKRPATDGEAGIPESSVRVPPHCPALSSQHAFSAADPDSLENVDWWTAVQISRLRCELSLATANPRTGENTLTPQTVPVKQLKAKARRQPPPGSAEPCLAGPAQAAALPSPHEQRRLALRAQAARWTFGTLRSN